MYFQYALVAKDSTILAEKSIIEWDYREVSLCILGNRLPEEEVLKIYKKPNTFYSITRPNGTTFISVCMSKIPENIQERFLLELEEKWNESQKFFKRIFSKKKDFGETEIAPLIHRYNEELKQKIDNYIAELEEQHRQYNIDYNQTVERLREAFRRGEELSRNESIPIRNSAATFHGNLSV